MNAAQIAEEISRKQKGQFFTLEVRRPAKTRKGVEDKIEKLSIIQGQASVDYSKRKAVREAVEAEERAAPELPSWITESFLEGEVRFWRGKEGQEYLPVCTVGKQKNTWLKNGEKVDFEDIKDQVLAAEYPKKVDVEAMAEKGQVPFNGIKVENIKAIR